MWLIDNSTVVTHNDNIHVQWRVIGTAGHYTLLVFTHNYALLTLGSQFLGCNVLPANNNQLYCGFTACSIGAARKPQQYNYNSLPVLLSMEQTHCACDICTISRIT